MRILLVEDDPEKARRLEDFLFKERLAQEVIVAKSFDAALSQLMQISSKESSSFDVMLLDMTMPTFDAAEDEPEGGAPEHFAGRDLLAQMKLRAITVPTIVITMFDILGEGAGRMSVGDLAKQLQRDFSKTFVGLVQYSQAKEGWRSTLRSMIGKIKR
ncbi:response regulator [Lysobacter helvus]|uniref:Response regulator n=2 Tax=Lysobacteraceae TaxID=32033 RepID=A0ABM7Q583_9GAMM|nr:MULTISPECIES: hypothetical protein [Lysobacter]BCT92461.1 response regulator [Lysobacter caseinilyticus]BCT95614.1 response regulator [Lysobacter helvus]